MLPRGPLGPAARKRTTFSLALIHRRPLHGCQLEGRESGRLPGALPRVQDPADAQLARRRPPLRVLLYDALQLDCRFAEDRQRPRLAEHAARRVRDHDADRLRVLRHPERTHRGPDRRQEGVPVRGHRGRDHERAVRAREPRRGDARRVGVGTVSVLSGRASLGVVPPAVWEGVKASKHLITPAVLRPGLSPGALLTFMAITWGLNGYFQAFGALSIVKINAHWFHVRERGTFSGVFGVLIRLGLLLAFQGVPLILLASSRP